MRDKIIFATVSLHISAFLYLLCGLGMLLLTLCCKPFENFASDSPPEHPPVTGPPNYAEVGFGIFFLLFCLALAVGIEVIAKGLKHRSYWAWFAAVYLFELYVWSVYFPLGVCGLWALLAEDSRAEFGVRTQPRSRPPTDIES